MIKHNWNHRHSTYTNIYINKQWLRFVYLFLFFLLCFFSSLFIFISFDICFPQCCRNFSPLNEWPKSNIYFCTIFRSRERDWASSHNVVENRTSIYYSVGTRIRCLSLSQIRIYIHLFCVQTDCDQKNRLYVLHKNSIVYRIWMMSLALL